MTKVVLNEEQYTDLIKKAHSLRYKKLDGVNDTIHLVNIPRRTEDIGMDIWSVYNRVQERLMVGTIYRSKKISSARRSLDFNDSLFNLVMTYTA